MNKYVKMCGKAKEIQEEWKPLVRDVVCLFFKESITFIKDKIFFKRYLVWGYPYPLCKEDMIWLPTQNQLQEMLAPYFTDIFSMIVGFGNWCDGTYSLEVSKSYVRQFATMEELWLALLMWERYKKIWDDEKEKWVEKEV